MAKGPEANMGMYQPSGLYVPERKLIIPVGLETLMDRRDFLRVAGLTGLAAGSAMALSGCETAGRLAKNWAYDFSLRVKEGDKVYTLVEKIDTPEEETGFKVLQAKRDSIVSQLSKYIDGKTVDDFTRELYNNRDVNHAGEILYHALKDNDAARKAIAKSLGIEVDDNVDWPVIVFTAMAAATFAFIVYSATSGGSAAAAATKGGPPGGGG